ncbi:hypothetical protein V8B97DRAFT_1221705 [Scleroderma yunnanense]
MTTCASSSITWSYSGGQAYLVLAVTNVGVSQNFVESNDLERRQNTAGITVLQTLANVSAQADSWTWTSINLAQGRYQIRGEVDTVTTLSAPFYILNGSDISCLPGVSASVPSPSVNPVSNTSSSHGKKTGVIAGVVVGVIAGICLVVALMICLRRRKRSPARGGFIERNMGRWGSLTSNTSMGRKSNDFTNRHYHGHTESTSKMLDSTTGSKSSNINPPGDFDERVTEIGESEKTQSTYSHSTPGISPLDALGNPVLSNRHSSMHSNQSPANTTDRTRSRTASVRTSNNTLEQQAQRIRSSMESSACLRTERLSIPVMAPVALDRSPSTPIRRTADYPVTVEASSVKRSASTSGSTTHRTPRKPVPHYNPSELPVQDGSDTRSSSTAAVGSTCNSAETIPSNDTPDVSRIPSFGHGRPVHYLIPDLPPSPKE